MKLSRFFFLFCFLAAAAAAALSSCDPFSPQYENLQCGPGDACPGGMLCDRGVCVPESAQVCGDGLIVGKEVCDDGNLADGDGCNATCAAATCYVPVTHDTLMSGLLDQACSTLYVHTGMYAERITLVRPLTLVGVGAMPPILDGQGAGTVVTVDTGVTATLRRLTVSNGRAAAGGGVLNRGTLVLDAVTVSDNTAAGEVPVGGGIENAGGTLTLSASTVAKNHLLPTGQPGVLAGAGIHSSGGTVRLDGGSKVEENDILLVGKAGFTAQGAGVGAVNTTLTIAGASAIRGNVINLDGGTGRASAQGGGLHVTGGSVAVTGGSLLEDNSILAKGLDGNGDTGAVAQGGGFYATSTALTFDSAFIRNNKVATQGDRSAFATTGGGHLRSGTLDGKGVTVTGNSVRADGLAATSEFTFASTGGLSLESVTGTLADSTISSNTVTVDSKSTATFSSASASIGGVELQSFGSVTRTVTILRCTIDGNTVTSLAAGGGARIGGLSADLGTGTAVVLNVNLVDSTVSNNLVQGPAGATGGGISAQAGTGETTVNLFIINSTISGNRVDAPAGSASAAGLYADTSTGSARVNVLLASSTVANNRASGMTSFAGGLSLNRGISMANTTFRSRNSIVADNVAANAPDCSSSNAAVLSSEGFNLFGVPGNCALATPNGERTGAAGLGPLADNGGPTRTHALLAGSQAINTGAQFGCTDPRNGSQLTNDQRGLPRIGGGRCDIGAYEAQ